MQSLSQLFTCHPQSVDESYWQHARVASSFAFTLALAASAALVHAVLPFMFERTASDLIQKLHSKLQARH